MLHHWIGDGRGQWRLATSPRPAAERPAAERPLLCALLWGPSPLCRWSTRRPRWPTVRRPRTLSPLPLRPVLLPHPGSVASGAHAALVVRPPSGLPNVPVICALGFGLSSVLRPLLRSLRHVPLRPPPPLSMGVQRKVPRPSTG